MKKFLIAPSILASSFANLEEVCVKLEEGKVDLIHIDVMDGHFVPNITVGPFFIKEMKKITKIPLDVHLMIENPEKYYEKFIENGASWVIIHFEAVIHHERIMKDIRNKGAKNGIAINPSTPVCFLEEILSYTDMVLVMGVSPGFSGQKLIPETIKKISKLNKIRDKKNLNFKIAFDGGVNLENAREIIKNGCDILMIGSDIFYYDDILSRIKEYRKIEV